MKVKRSYAMGLYDVLSNAQYVFGSAVTGRFRYMCSHNRKVTEEECKLVDEAFPLDSGFVDYERRRRSILNDAGIHSDDDLKKLSADEVKALEDAVIKLRGECSDAISAQQAIDAERAKFCDEEIDIDLRKIGMADIPEITAENHWAVWDLIEPLVDESIN